MTRTRLFLSTLSILCSSLISAVVVATVDIGHYLADIGHRSAVLMLDAMADIFRPTSPPIELGGETLPEVLTSANVTLFDRPRSAWRREVANPSRLVANDNYFAGAGQRLAA